MNSIHLKFINEAHNIALKKFGTTFPNPIVGCVIARNKKIISQAVTNKSGRPHAEELALKKAGKKAKGASMYVTLEPCTHYGKTPPCVKTIIKSKIKKVVYSINDVDPRTSGKAYKLLKLNTKVLEKAVLKSIMIKLHYMKIVQF